MQCSNHDGKIIDNSMVVLHNLYLLYCCIWSYLDIARISYARQVSCNISTSGEHAQKTTDVFLWKAIPQKQICRLCERADAESLFQTQCRRFKCKWVSLYRTLWTLLEHVWNKRCKKWEPRLRHVPIISRIHYISARESDCFFSSSVTASKCQRSKKLWRPYNCRFVLPSRKPPS